MEVDKDLETDLPVEGRQTMRPEKLQDLLQFVKVGRCVNGVAHDVNNCLGAILAYAELTSLDPHLEPEPRRMVNKILDAVERASALISELTNVARPLKPVAGVVDFRHLIKGVLLLRDYDFRIAQIETEFDLDEALPSIIGDVSRMRLAVLYLVLNAEEAVRHAAVRKLSIGVHATEGAIELTFHNSGPDIEEGIREQIFDAFFTTKEGFHLGLGLGAAREIIEAHDGTLRYEPERGFVVHLPFHRHTHEEA